MTSTTPAGLRGQWLAADDNISVTEALAVFGVVIWVGALIWLIASDISRVRSRTRGHSQERPR